MEQSENKGDPSGEQRLSHESSSEVRPDAADEYELTAKDAGWRTPTLLISPAEFVYFDPPRPKKETGGRCDGGE
ncbi:MAG TPA: hypothetical protein VFI31_20410 [Pirellulales bacterium]|nr:hypothetical protein [Pirellulales bacterium]